MSSLYPIRYLPSLERRMPGIAVSSLFILTAVYRLLSQVLPVDSAGDTVQDIHDHDSKDKPEFSLGTMSANFRRFNSRIGVVFVFQSKLIRLLSWRKYSHTISLLLVYTFICLDPSLLSVLPLAILLLGVFIPAFLARHPAPPVALTSSFEYSPKGPPIAPAPTVKPVKELSKDFFRNMRDLQNCMEDFSVVHDGVIGLVGPKVCSSSFLSATVTAVTDILHYLDEFQQRAAVKYAFCLLIHVHSSHVCRLAPYPLAPVFPPRRVVRHSIRPSEDR